MLVAAAIATATNTFADACASARRSFKCNHLNNNEKKDDDEEEEEEEKEILRSMLCMMMRRRRMLFVCRDIVTLLQRLHKSERLEMLLSFVTNTTSMSTVAITRIYVCITLHVNDADIVVVVKILRHLNSG